MALVLFEAGLLPQTKPHNPDFSFAEPLKGRELMKPVVGLALVVIWILALTGCTLPGAATPTATLPPFPPVSSKAPPPVNTLAPLPTFTGQAPRLPSSTPTQSPTQPVPKSTQVAPTLAPTVLPSVTKVGPTLPAPTATPLPTKAPTAQPSATKAPTQAPTTGGSTAKDPKIFLVAVGDNGVAGKKIGCGDSLVGATVQVTDPAAPLRGALDKLLAIKTQTYGQSGLYDALFRSDLHVASVIITNGVAEIKLTGALTLGGVCDSPRVQAQLEETALQFSSVQKVNILVNGIPLQNLLSLK
jgi:hypothetical protein